MLSVVINNYNNGAYLREAMDSSLAQDDERVEVVVVDDGSTDESRAIIDSYGARVLAVFQENAGQGAALNAGFGASRGEAIIFLDSDDRLEPWAARSVRDALRAHPDAAKVHWPLHVIDGSGAATGELNHADVEPGDLAGRVLAGGPYSYRWAPTSGNAWRRDVLDQIMPVDERAFSHCADNYLSALAPLFGGVVVSDPLSCWRRHPANYTAARRPFDDRLREWVDRFDAILSATRYHAERLGLPFDQHQWLAESWYHRVDRAVEVIDALVAPRAPLVLVDEDEWGVDGLLRGHPCAPLPERGGMYAGRPADKKEARAALEHASRGSAAAVAIAWPAFWWLEYYDLGPALSARFADVIETPDVWLFLRRD